MHSSCASFLMCILHLFSFRRTAELVLSHIWSHTILNW
jgi:hypothetical protein